jgi:hypothetical protein
MNLLLSGGAAGADYEWGKAALEKGHDVIHWSFSGHKSKDPQHTHVLTQDELNEADDRLIFANKSIKRQFPTKDNFINNLLRRNWYQVATAESLYCVAHIIKDNSLMGISGGTAWAATMFLDRVGDRAKIHLFDQFQNQWFVWDDGWEKEQIIYIPPPEGVYAGIGSRMLNDDGLAAIKEIF